jgi:NAD(P)-dependent dehydrogenase (short-subunit alcohol dehydrogenase family)
MAKLLGKMAVVTGGTSGIGFATAKSFVDEGAFVFITGRRQKKLDEAVKAIGSNVVGVRGDVSNLQDLDRLYEIVKAEGKIDILVANAGVGEFASACPDGHSRGDVFQPSDNRQGRQAGRVGASKRPPYCGALLSSSAIARQGEAGDRTGFNACSSSPAPSTASKPASRGAARGR